MLLAIAIVEKKDLQSPNLPRFIIRSRKSEQMKRKSNHSSLNLLEATKSIPPQEIAEFVNQLYEISKSESVARAEVSEYVRQKIEEKRDSKMRFKKRG
jgi:hypothetical protein